MKKTLHTLTTVASVFLLLFAPSSVAWAQSVEATFTTEEDGLTVNVDASGSSADAGIDFYEWEFTGGGAIDGSGERASWTYTEPGTYTIFLLVTDNDGNTANAEETVTVGTLFEEGDECLVQAAIDERSRSADGLTVTFTSKASGAGAGYSIIGREWYADGTYIGSGLEATHTYPNDGDDHNIELTVESNQQDPNSPVANCRDTDSGIVGLPSESDGDGGGGSDDTPTDDGGGGDDNDGDEGGSDDEQQEGGGDGRQDIPRSERPEGSYEFLAPIPGLGGDFIVINESATSSDSFLAYVNNFVQLLIGLAGLLAIIMIIYGGVTYMTTDAVTGKKSAIGIIQRALGGLVLALVSVLILNTINPALTATRGVEQLEIDGERLSDVPEPDTTNDGAEFGGDVYLGDDRPADQWCFKIDGTLDLSDFFGYDFADDRYVCYDTSDACDEGQQESEDLFETDEYTEEDCGYGYQACGTVILFDTQTLENTEDEVCGAVFSSEPQAESSCENMRSNTCEGQGSSCLEDGQSCSIDFDTVSETCTNCSTLSSSAVPVAPFSETRETCEGQRDGEECQANSTLVSRLGIIDVDENWFVTEAWPPTVQHQCSCHSNGTCVDTQLDITVRDNPSIAASYINEASNRNLTAILEVPDADEQDRFAAHPNLDDTNVIVVPGVSTHFSVYLTPSDGCGIHSS